MSDPSGTVRLKRSGGVATITLDRPERRNALDRATTHDLLRTLKGLVPDEEVSLVCLRGEGAAFSIGMDLIELIELREREDDEAFADWLRASQEVVHVLIDALPQPVFAIVDGPAAGSGFGLAAACDGILPTNRATFGATQVRLGLHPDAGLTYTLPRRVRHAAVVDLLATGRIIDGHEAHRIGLIEPIATVQTFVRELDTRARRLQDAPPALLGSVKRASYQGEPTLHQVLESEFSAQMHAFRSPLSLERLAAVLRRAEREPA